MNIYEHNGFKVYAIPYVVPNRKKIIDTLLDLSKVFRGDIKTREESQELLNKNTKLNLLTGPGLQVSTNFSGDADLNEFTRLLSHKVLEFHNNNFSRKGSRVFKHWWTYMSYPVNKDSNYHTHENISPLENHMTNTWTCTYYLQLPDNCIGDEGKLAFSYEEDDDTALKIFPDQDTIYIFEGSLPHKPFINPNSTIPRIVLAGNIFIPFDDKVLI